VVRPGYYAKLRGWDESLHEEESWLAVGLALFFISAIFATPFWLFCTKKFGKRNTWLGFNAMNGLTNALFIFVGPGDVTASLIVTALNGAPLGARFLNDSTLADTIDYDEFMNGERREAQFTMFISFVPKIVSIPTQAIPIAMIAAAGFVESKDGVAQEQPASVATMISIIYIAFPVVMNIFSFMVKWNYPIKSDETNRKIAEVRLPLSFASARRATGREASPNLPQPQLTPHRPRESPCTRRAAWPRTPSRARSCPPRPS
jgi:Na+/melibiose symporter-like transporter